MNKIKVLIVDDSALVRSFLSEVLSEDSAIEVIGTAMDPIFALSKIMKDQPDVITLDVEMPRMDGLTFLEKLMQTYPIPVVMISSLTKKGCDTTIKAMELGAVDFITKPSKNLFEQLGGLKAEIIRKVKNASRANLRRTVGTGSRTGLPAEGSQQKSEFHPDAAFATKPGLVVIGASTGGVVAVKKVVAGLDPREVSVLIVLHMPEGFTASFAQNLNGTLPFPVKEAGEGEMLKPGCFYVAPGNRNTMVEKAGSRYRIAVKRCDREDIYRPSVDKTYISVAKSCGKHAVAVILTGMGDDGARGMFLLHQAGAYTIAQSKETSMIFGMPRRAIEMGGVTEVLHLEQISGRVNQLVKGKI